MAKKIYVAIGVLILIALTFVLSKKEKIITEKEDIISIQNRENENDQNSSTRESSFVSESEALQLENKQLSRELNNLNLKVEERISMLINLNLDKYQKEKTEELVNFIVSKNPYNEDVDPHSADALSYQKEAALRIFAIRKLAENLSLEKFDSAVLEIEKKSEDSALKSIASQALDSKKQGRNYFEDTVKAVEGMSHP